MLHFLENQIKHAISRIRSNRYIILDFFTRLLLYSEQNTPSYLQSLTRLHPRLSAWTVTSLFPQLFVDAIWLQFTYNP